MSECIQIGDRIVGPGQPVYIVAEMSANHHQDFAEAVSCLHAAKEAGADAIKVQTYTPDTLTIDCDNECFRIGEGSVWKGRKLYELYEEAYMPWDWQPRLRDEAQKVGLDFFSTAFDASSVDFLETLNVPCYKIASFESTDIPFLKNVASTGKPVIISMGMASLEEIEEAVRALRSGGCGQLALLKCTSAYPAPAEEMNLRTIPHLAKTFGVPVGLSDHTLAIAVPVVAVALGACILEKHFTLSRNKPGPDSVFSLEPDEFSCTVRAVRTAEQALGETGYETTSHEEASRVFRRSLFVVQDVKKGEVFSADNVRSIRPGYGLSPRNLDDILGRVALCDVPRGTPLSWNIIQGSASNG